jgi:hypothetical protein
MSIQMMQKLQLTRGGKKKGAKYPNDNNNNQMTGSAFALS